jgi:hypothetical protein
MIGVNHVKNMQIKQSGFLETEGMGRNKIYVIVEKITQEILKWLKDFNLHLNPSAQILPSQAIRSCHSSGS